MSDTMVMMLAAVGAELVLLLFVLLAVSFFRGRSAVGRDRQALNKLVARIRQEKPQREQAIEEFLGTRLGLEGEALQGAKTALLRAEIGLLQRFVGIYRQRDAALAARFDGDLYATLDAYHGLTAGAAAAAASLGEAGDMDASEVEQLRSDNARLEEELRITMETMSRMLNEYSTMFAGGEPATEGAQSASAAVSPDSPAEPAVDPAEPPVGSDTQIADDPAEAIADAAASEPADESTSEPVPEAAAEPVVADATVAETTEPLPPGDPPSTGDDPLAEVLREAASREEQVRGAESAAAVAGDAKDGAPDPDSGAGVAVSQDSQQDDAAADIDVFVDVEQTDTATDDGPVAGAAPMAPNEAAAAIGEVDDEVFVDLVGPESEADAAVGQAAARPLDREFGPDENDAAIVASTRLDDAQAASGMPEPAASAEAIPSAAEVPSDDIDVFIDEAVATVETAPSPEASAATEGNIQDDIDALFDQPSDVGPADAPAGDTATVEPAVIDDDLFDAVEVVTEEAVPTQAEQQGTFEAPDGELPEEDLFDAGSTPLKKQSGS